MKKPKSEKEILVEFANIEAINIKKHATKEELKRLDFDSLDPESRISCIYGQMTGSCNTKRAKSLIVKCATKVLVQREGESIQRSAMREFVLNGKPKKQRESEREYVSPIESVIVRYPELNKELINFLKGKTKHFIKPSLDK